MGSKFPQRLCKADRERLEVSCSVSLCVPEAYIYIWVWIQEKLPCLRKQVMAQLLVIPRQYHGDGSSDQQWNQDVIAASPMLLRASLQGRKHWTSCSFNIFSTAYLLCVRKTQGKDIKISKLCSLLSLGWKGVTWWSFLFSLDHHKPKWNVYF